MRNCDKQMVESLDQIPYGEMPKWGQTKRKLGLGVSKKTEIALG